MHKTGLSCIIVILKCNLIYMLELFCAFLLHKLSFVHMCGNLRKPTFKRSGFSISVLKINPGNAALCDDNP